MNVLIALTFVLFFVSGCLPQRGGPVSPMPSLLEKFRDIPGECCSLCQSAFSQSPVSVGPSAARCGGFTSAMSIGEECDTYFTQHAMTVQQCQERTNSPKDI